MITTAEIILRLFAAVAIVFFLCQMARFIDRREEDGNGMNKGDKE